ncbi:MAG: porin [Paludibacterium sp.]|uniref:porin n=1 Tax=Paludibacterium sp. TaxID=1917523 RepID=UPI0025CF103F|nr:porin [Paludibacterium sp.]MBV8048369.1 porin [Paludibacterium sp.]MBV8647698.1 porin [Paludibacterium sp.]
MQKKTLLVALGAALATQWAFADSTTIYGVMSASVESASATGGTTTYPTQTRVADNNSRIGFKGTEDLGNGLQTIWQVENSLKYFEQGGTNDAGSSATFATRNTFVGLASPVWGTFQMGYYDSAYKRLTNGGVNVMGDTAADIDGTTTNVAAIFSRGEARLKNSINYTSPSWNGLQGGISYGYGENQTSTQTGARNHLSLAAAYTWQALQIGAGWDRTYNTGGYLGYFAGVNGTGSVSNGLAYSNGQDVTFTKLVASYKFASGTYVGAGVEHGEYGVAGSSAMGQTGWTVAAAQDIGPATVKLSYSKLGSLSNTATPDAYQATEWVLGGVYNLSKSTQLLSYYARIKNNAMANVDFANTPLYTSGVGSSSAVLAPGNRLSVFGLGMKVCF